MREGGHGDGGGGGDDDDDEEAKGEGALIQDIARFQGHCCHRTDRARTLRVASAAIFSLSCRLFLLMSLFGYESQDWAKEWPLGCMNPVSQLPLAAGREFTQPRDHYFTQPCIPSPN